MPQIANGVSIRSRPREATFRSTSVAQACGPFADIYANSEHVRNIDLHAASDSEIWDYAKESGCAIVTKDEDFHVRSVLEGPPPKILWIRSGNCSTELVETLLRKNASEIERFQAEATLGFLTLR